MIYKGQGNKPARLIERNCKTYSTPVSELKSLKQWTNYQLFLRIPLPSHLLHWQNLWSSVGDLLQPF